MSTDDEKDLDRRNSSDMHGMVGPLDAEMPTADAHPVVMDNFNFTPATVSVPVGTTVRWTNRDDVPHNVVSTEQTFTSPVLDTDEHGALRNRLRRILRQRARTNEGSARERGGHAGQSLNVERMNVMRRFTFAAGLAALALGLGACGSGYGGSTPTGPTADGTLPNGAIVINIVAENGDRSFSPNPATVPAGSTVVWHNVDGLTHRVLLNDRGLDTGNIAPGAYSQPMTLAAPGPYHCTIHPDMIGVAQSVQTSAGTTDPY